MGRSIWNGVKTCWRVGYRLFEIYTYFCLALGVVAWVAASIYTGHVLTPDEFMDLSWLPEGQ